MNTKKRIRILCFLLAVVLLQQTDFSRHNLVYASDETVQTKAVSENVPQKPVDIVLSVGSSYLGLDGFEKDLKEGLEANGVDLGCVNIKTFDGVEISSNSKDAYSIFTTWKSFPFNSSIYWKYDSTNKWLTTSFNESWETGFLDMTGGYIKDFTMTANVQGPDYQQPLGFVFRVQPSEQYSGRWDLYYFWTSTDGYGGNEKVFAIFKVEGQNLNAATRPNWSGTYSATPLMRFSNRYFGWPYHAPYDFGGYPNYTPYKTGVTVSNKADPTMKTTTIAIGSVPTISAYSWYNLNLNVNGNHYTAEVNNQKVIDVVDNDNPYTEGYYGIFSYSHVNPKFKDIQINQKRYKSLIETLDTTQWRENSTRILINLNDKQEEAFATEASMAEVLAKGKQAGIFYVGWGNETNVLENETFIEKNGGKGFVVDNGNYTEAIKKIVSYVTKISRFQEGSGTKEDPYIIRSKEQLTYIKYYLDAYFRVEEDIDYTGYVLEPIGTYDAPFTGHIDGNGHGISNLIIHGSGAESPTGFFGVVHGGSITNLTFHHITVTGSDYVGAIAGYISGGCSITNCYVEMGEITGSSYVGGFAGYMEGGVITESSVTVTVCGKAYIGGFFGQLSGAIIKDCMSFATVTGVERVGGIIGSCVETRVENCSSFATIIGNNMVGGLAGYHDGTDSGLLAFSPVVTDCSSFATVKGSTNADSLVGYKLNTVFENCVDYATTEQGEETII